MEQPVYHDRDEHVIDIANTGIASGSVSHGNDHNDSDQQLNGDLAASTTTQVTVMQSSASSATTTSRNSLGALHDPGFWNLASLALKVIQITAAVVVIPVSISRHEHPPTALFTWITVYTATLFATILCELWDYVQHRHISASVSPRLIVVVLLLELILTIFSDVWTFVGIIHLTTTSHAPILLWLTEIFWEISIIRLTVHAMVRCYCCCIYCCIQWHKRWTRGATPEAIMALQTYKILSKSSQEGQAVGGALAIGMLHLSGKVCGWP